MKKEGKRGFTITELVIVIAVIAILAAVLIPTFVTLVDRARETQDVVNTRNMNTVLITEDDRITAALEDGDAYSQITGRTINSYGSEAERETVLAYYLMLENGYNMGAFSMQAEDTVLLYDAQNRQYIYVQMSDGEDPEILYAANEAAVDLQNNTYYAILFGNYAETEMQRNLLDKQFGGNVVSVALDDSLEGKQLNAMMLGLEEILSEQAAIDDKTKEKLEAEWAALADEKRYDESFKEIWMKCRYEFESFEALTSKLKAYYNNKEADPEIKKQFPVLPKKAELSMEEAPSMPEKDLKTWCMKYFSKGLIYDVENYQFITYVMNEGGEVTLTNFGRGIVTKPKPEDGGLKLYPIFFYQGEDTDWFYQSSMELWSIGYKIFYYDNVNMNLIKLQPDSGTV